MGSNPPSLESISSGHSALSDNSNEGESLFPTSPDHRGAKGSSSSSMRRTTSDTSVNDSVHKQTAQEMLRIEKLEAMIADISTFGQDQDSGGPSSLVLDCYSTPEVVRKSVETQTLSTGDIVITKVYNTEQQQ